MAYTMTKEAVETFARQNKLAMQFLMVATDEYAAARCCLFNGLLSGLVLGAQAVEKYLKAFILFRDSTKNVRKLSHKISSLANQASSLDSSFSSSQYAQLITKLEQHYNTRYPDNLDASKHMSSSEIDELDQFVIFINEKMGVPLEVKYRSGFYAQINSSLERSVLFPTERWIKENNKALIPLLPSIQSQYLAVRNHLYPNISNSP